MVTTEQPWYYPNKREHERKLEALTREWAPTRYSRTFGPIRVEIETSGDGSWDAAIWAAGQIIETRSFNDIVVSSGVKLGLDNAKEWAEDWIASIVRSAEKAPVRDCLATDAYLVLDPSEVEGKR